MGCAACTRDPYKIIAMNNKKQAISHEEIKNSVFSIHNNYNTVNPSGAQTNMNNISLSKIDKLSREYFSINIYIQDIKHQVIYNIHDKKDFMLVSDLLNKAIFLSDEWDCNFTSEYISSKDKFNYKIERLNWIGKESKSAKKNTSKKETPEIDENASSQKKNIKSWIVYIDNVEESISELVNLNRVVHKDNIIDIKPIYD